MAKRLVAERIFRYPRGCGRVEENLETRSRKLGELWDAGIRFGFRGVERSERGGSYRDETGKTWFAEE